MVEAVLVEVGDSVQAGDTLVQLDSDTLLFAVEKAEQNLTLQEANLTALQTGATEEDIAAAEAAVQSAQANLDNLLAGPSEQEIAESEANIRTQQAGVASASASYNSTQDSISASALASAEADLISARITFDNAQEAFDKNDNPFTYANLTEAQDNLTQAQTAFDELNAGPNQGTLNNASANISAAIANREQAEANHAALLAGATEAQIAAARSALAQAESSLDNLLTPASAENIAVAEAQVEQARLALLDAQESLAQATMTAPFAGLITAVYIAEGEYATGDVVELVSDELHVILDVDEVDIGTLSQGQEAIITLETWPDTEITSQIRTIAPTANDNSNVVVYEVILTLSETDLPVLVGMTANARLVTANRSDVLLVPNAAITADREAGTYNVNLVTGEDENGQPTTEPTAVTIGLRDEGFTEITSGLAEGDEVVIGELSGTTLPIW